MSQVEAVFFGCDGTLADSEVICPRAYVTIFRKFGIHVDLEKIFIYFKGVKFYGTIDIISKEQGVTMVWVDAEYVYRTEAARLFDTEFEDIVGANELLTSINVPVCVAPNDLVSEMQHSLGKFNMLHYFPEKLFGGYDVQCRKPDPVLMFRVAKTMNVDVESCILADDSNTGT